MPRPKYKQLYLREKASRQAFEDRSKELQHELDRLRGVLAPYGLTVLRALPPEARRHVLPPMKFECAKAAIEVNNQIVQDEGLVGARLYAWQGAPIICNR